MSKYLKDLLSTLGYSVKYSHWGSAPTYPCIVYRFSDSNDFLADNKNYHAIRRYDVELYAEQKNESIESEIEELFSSERLVYSKIENYDSAEELFITTYQTTLIGD